MAVRQSRTAAHVWEVSDRVPLLGSDPRFWVEVRALVLLAFPASALWHEPRSGAEKEPAKKRRRTEEACHFCMPGASR